MILTWIRNHKIILFALVIFLCAIWWINPLRELPIDDDWAYALTVKNLIETGQYILHPWAAANFPFQVILGLLFVKAFGYSFSSLRLSTLFLTLTGLASLYLFARELKLDRRVSGTLVLTLLACPLYLKFSLSYMTDIPFLSLLTLSAFLYWRAFFRNSFLFAFLASIGCAAAILTRQLGVALLGAVFLYGFTYFRNKLTVKMAVLTLVLPILATIWQLQAAFLSPNWGMVMVKEAQKLYFSDLAGVLIGILIRPAYILIYLSLFVLPLLVFMAVRLKAKLSLKNFLIVSTYIFGSLIVGKLKWNMPLTFPYLPWAFGNLVPWDPIIVRILITAGILICSIMFGASVCSHAKQIKKEMIKASGIGFIYVIILFLLIYSLIFYKLGDEYLLVFVPFILLVFGRWFQKLFFSRLLYYSVMGIAILSIVTSSIITKNDMIHGEAYWKSCEELRLSGIAIADISCNWMWVSTYSYQKYIDQTEGIKHSNLNDFFKRWLPEKERAAKYLVTDTPDRYIGNMTIQKIVPYEKFPFGRANIYVMLRK